MLHQMPPTKLAVCLSYRHCTDLLEGTSDQSALNRIARQTAVFASHALKVAAATFLPDSINHSGFAGLPK